MGYKSELLLIKENYVIMIAEILVINRETK